MAQLKNFSFYSLFTFFSLSQTLILQRPPGWYILKVNLQLRFKVHLRLRFKVHLRLRFKDVY